MYGMIDRGYGILLQDMDGIQIDNVDFLRDYILLDSNYLEGFDLKESDIKTWSAEECLEYIIGAGCCWAAYSG